MGRTIQQHQGPALSCLCCKISSVRALSCPLSSRLHMCFSIPPEGSRAVDQQAQSCGDTLSTIMLHLLSLHYLLPRKPSPTCSHWFCTIHPSPECLCAQIRLCACTGTHSHWHTAGIICHHNSVLPLQC